MIIYKLTNKQNGKIYIGQTCRKLEHRLKAHETARCKSYIKNAIKKYGMQGFNVEVIDSASNCEELNGKEIKWIAHYGCTYPNGYNLCVGGGGLNGFKHSEKTRKKLSDSKKGELNPFYGKPSPATGRVHTETAKKLNSDKHKELWNNQEYREKQVKAHLGNKGFWTGKKFSEEHKRNLSESHKRKVTH